MKTIKKYNIGSPKRPGKKSKTATSYKKKYNIGPPGKVVVTPDTPRSNEWKQIREKRNHINHEISDYEPDEDDEVLENESDHRTYTTFEETVTPYMKYALQKKPFTRSPKGTGTGTQVHENDDEAWGKKNDDSPNKLYPTPKRLLPYPKSPSKIHRPSRTKGRGRSRSRSRGKKSRG
jgi:hypothetical protein